MVASGVRSSKGGGNEEEDREEFRRELTQLLSDAHGHLELTPEASTYVTKYIENYEFGLAYELMIYELRGKELPANALGSLNAAAVMMGPGT
jgi:hypothetical protein